MANEERKLSNIHSYDYNRFIKKKKFTAHFGGIMILLIWLSFWGFCKRYASEWDEMVENKKARIMNLNVIGKLSKRWTEDIHISKWLPKPMVAVISNDFFSSFSSLS